MQTITATDLARNTRAILDTVMTRGEVICVERNHVTIAKIVPAEHPLPASQALAGLQQTLSAQQARAWRDESKSDFDHALRDPWA